MASILCWMFTTDYLYNVKCKMVSSQKNGVILIAILYLCTGAAVGDMFCNQESHRITNTTFWTFTVGIYK